MTIAKRSAVTLIALAFLPAGALAEGDPAAGEKAYRACRACHTIQDGDTMYQRGGPTGPNLFGVIGRQAGTTDFRYGADLVTAGEQGLVWDEENIAAYMTDPRQFLRDYLGDDGAKVKMTFKQRNQQADIAAYLASFSAPAGEEAGGETGG